MSVSFNTLKKFLQDNSSWSNTLFLGTTKSRCKDFICLIDNCIKDDSYELSKEEHKKYMRYLEQEASYMNMLISRGNFSSTETKVLEYYSLLMFNVADLLEAEDSLRSTLLLNQLFLEKELSYSEAKTLVNFYMRKHFYGDRSQASSFSSTKYIEETFENEKGY